MTSTMRAHARTVFRRFQVEEALLYESRLIAAGPAYAVKVRGRLGSGPSPTASR